MSKKVLKRRSYLGAGNPHWKGGKANLGDGYVYCLDPTHPRAEAKGYVNEALLLVEAVLGKSLPDSAILHHVDENRGRNVRGNLVVCEDRAYHNLLHQRMRALKECGHADWRRCWICKEYDDPDNPDLVIYERPERNSADVYHRSCLAAYQNRLWRGKRYARQQSAVC